MNNLGEIEPFCHMPLSTGISSETSSRIVIKVSFIPIDLMP